MTQLKKHLGAKIRHYRKRLGLSQEQLADRADLHRTYIGAIERGDQNVSIDNIEKIATALKVDVIKLFK